ncbi:hypothetical protein D3C74_50700 [compost metagenome]
MSLKNEDYANKTIVTGFGHISFDETGTVSHDLEDHVLEALAPLKGFTRLTELEGKQTDSNEGNEDPEKQPEQTEDDKEGPVDTEEEKPKSKRGAHLNKKKDEVE